MPRRIPEEDIERVKSDCDLVALVQSRGVTLKQQGANWTGLCPFHDDRKTPNLIVTPGKGLFRCMASQCGKTGNAIQFGCVSRTGQFNRVFQPLPKRRLDKSVQKNIIQAWQSPDTLPRGIARRCMTVTWSR